MKLVSIVGARPQFVKAAMVSRALTVWNAGNPAQETITEVLVHTGQHYHDEMSGTFFRDMAIPAPAYHLGVGSGPHGQQTGRMLEQVERVLGDERPDYVLVYGDTNSTLAGGLAAAKLHLPVAHVEAGLRSHNRLMPEELNRILVDHLSTLLFCPTPTAVKNLHAEGVGHGVFLVGDVMADALRRYLPSAEGRGKVLKRYGLTARGYYLATVHRAENTDSREALSSILLALASAQCPVVLPCHPRTRKMIDQFGLGHVVSRPNLRLIDPVGYLDMLSLEAEAGIVLTDSGGVQKEAYWAGVPCVTLRRETEWVETVEAGGNVLAGTETQAIREALDRAAAIAPRSRTADDPCDQPASQAIVERLVSAVAVQTAPLC